MWPGPARVPIIKGAAEFLGTYIQVHNRQDTEKMVHYGVVVSGVYGCRWVHQCKKK